MTVMPGLTCKYDAWNRLVEVGSNIRYDYNGLNQRVRKTVNGVTTTSFFNSQWQELELSGPQSKDCGSVNNGAYTDDGIAVNSNQYNGLTTAEFKEKITAALFGQR